MTQHHYHNHKHPLKRISAYKIACLSLLPLLNQVLPSLWLMTSGTSGNGSGSTLSYYHPFLWLGGKPLEELNGAGRALSEAPVRPPPRVVYLEPGKRFNLVLAVHANYTLELEEREPPYYPMPKEHPCEGYPREECRVASGHLHRANFPSCNSFHEMDLTHMLTANGTTTARGGQAKLIGMGGKRMVWRVLQDATQEDDDLIALKMFKYRKERHHDFGPLALEYQRRDAVMHQAGAASPYIINIYGFCGASAMNEFGDGGELQGNIDKRGALEDEKLLATAYEISAGLRDFHTIGILNKKHPPALAHADIYGNQWVRVKGQYKLTDFNLAKFLIRNRTTFENFPFRREVIDNWFAPEVHRQGGIKESIVTEAMDLWGLGNVLYLILTGRKPFQGIHRNDVHKMIMDRTVIRPPIPTELRKSPAFAHRAIIQAIDWCHQELPQDRPTSRQLANFLRKALLDFRNYKDLDEFNSRRQRFPSIQDRVKRYMSSWYTSPCANDPAAHIRYQILRPKKYSKNQNTQILFQALNEEDHIVKIKAKLQTDDAMILQPHMLDPTNMIGNHAGYRADIIQTVLPFWRALQDKPLLTQWGDKTSFVLSDLTRLDESHAPLSMPHLKKCRRVLTQQQIEQLTPADTCRGDNSDDFGSTTPQHFEPTFMQPIIWKLDSHRLLGNIEFVPKYDRPWAKKKDKAVWRGRLTGNALRADRSVIYRDEVTEEEYCDYLERCRLVRKHHKSNLVDAKVIEMRHKPINSTINGVPLMGNKMLMEDFLEYKVLIVLEGNDIPSGLGWSLRSNSVVVMPRPTWSSWLMEELLEPWVHYVPLDPSLKDVEEKIQWILDNDEEAQRISHRASLWIKDLLEHPDAQADNDEVFKRMLNRYQKHFLYSDTLLEQYETQVEAPTRPPKAKKRQTFERTH